MHHIFFKSRFILLLICVFSTVYIHANETVNTIPKFQNWIENKVLCKNHTVKISVMNRDFINQIKQLGFDISIDIDEESQNYEGEILVSNKAITIFNFNLQKIKFYQDSGTGFYAFVQASPDSLKKIVKNNQLDNFLLADSDEENNIFTFLTSKPEPENPYGEKNKGIIINTTNQEGVSSIGCREFDY